MKFHFSGIIRLKENKIGFKKPLFFTSPINKINTKVEIRANDDLVVGMEIEAENFERAQKMAELELARVSSLLSWFENIGIEKYWITGHSIPNDKGGYTVISKLTISRSIDDKKTLNIKSVKELEKNMNVDHANDVSDILLMWTEALTQNSTGMRFFLFYRILEKLIDPNNSMQSTTKTDTWLKSNYPKLPLEGKRSILTFLRDNIHAKSPNFPFEKIDQYINNLQEIARKAIEDKVVEKL